VPARATSTAWQPLRRATWDDDGNENSPEDDEGERRVGHMSRRVVDWVGRARSVRRIPRQERGQVKGGKEQPGGCNVCCCSYMSVAARAVCVDAQRVLLLLHCGVFCFGHFLVAIDLNSKWRRPPRWYGVCFDCFDWCCIVWECPSQ